MNPAFLTSQLQSYLAGAPNALVLEEGEVVFDMTRSKYSISGDREKCLLHLWSDERNTVRRVLESQEKNGILCLTVQRFGQSRPHKLEICRDRDGRATATKKTARTHYQHLLARVISRAFPDYRIDRLVSTMDLEHSLSPVYARGLMRRGRSSFAVFGVNAEETQASVDGALTFAVLWLQHCRERESAASVVHGLRLFVPAGKSEVVRTRLGWLNSGLAEFELYELNEREETIALDASDRGNIATRLVQCPDEQRARERFAAAIERLSAFLPDAQVMVVSSNELAFRLNGLEIARVKMAYGYESRGTSFDRRQIITFGAGAYETELTTDREEMFAELVRGVRKSRCAEGDRHHPLWRMQPERWLESAALSDLTKIENGLDSAYRYSQVPAFSASDRVMIDLLTCTREGRLVVLELKADEDIHLPLQGLDYWARVRWHQNRNEFRQFGYFSGRQLSADPPLLILVAPAFRIHPTTDTLLRYLSPEVECILLGIDERWREGIKVVFRKTRARAAGAG